MSGTKWIWVFAVVAACDFTPPPKKQAAPGAAAVAVKPVAKPVPAPAPTTPPGPTLPANPTTVPPPSNIQPAAATPECLETAAHLLEVSLASITSANEREAQARNKTQLVRSVAEECTTKKWSQQAQDCFKAGATAEAMRGCESLIDEGPAKP